MKDVKTMTTEELEKETQSLLERAENLTTEFLNVEDYSIAEYTDDMQKIRERYLEIWSEASERM